LVRAAGLLALLLLLTAIPSVAFAESYEYWIIVSGDGSEAKAKDLFEANKRLWPKDVVTAPQFPKLVKSDGIAGLRPGYTVTVAGGCKDRKRAERVRAALARTFRGTYVRTVTAYYYSPSTCPQLAGGRTQDLPEGFDLEQTAPVDGKKKLFWRVYLKANDTCEGSSVLVRLVDAKRRVLDEYLVEAQCVHGDGEEDLGSQTGWTYAMSDGDPASIELSGTSWAFDTPNELGLILRAEGGRIAHEAFDPRERRWKEQQEAEQREPGETKKE
jgi:hypothetical protein